MKRTPLSKKEADEISHLGVEYGNSWPHIVPFLRKEAVLEALRSDPEAKVFLDNFLNQRNGIKVDAAFIARYPVKGHAHLYEHVGRDVTTLTVSNIKDSDMKLIFTHFKRVLHLTLENISVVNVDSRFYPSGLKSLNLLKCSLPQKLLQSLKAENPKLKLTFCRVPNRKKKMKLTTMNDDCLIAVMSYLPLDDLISMGHTHPRFKQLIETHKVFKGRVTIDKEFLKKHPLKDSKEIYEMIGKTAANVDIHGVYEAEMLQLFPFFPKVQHLFVKIRKLGNLKGIESFPRVPILRLKVRKASDEYFTALFKHLDATLTILDISHSAVPGQCLEQLHNIQEFYVSGATLYTDMTKFWEQNQQLEKILMDMMGVKGRKRNNDQIMDNIAVVRANPKIKRIGAHYTLDLRVYDADDKIVRYE